MKPTTHRTLIGLALFFTVFALRPVLAAETDPEEIPSTNSSWTIERFGWSGELESRAAVRVINLHGDLRVRDAGGDEVEISALIQQDARDHHRADVRVENDAQGLTVEVVYTAKEDGASAELPKDLIRRVDLVLFLPPGVPLIAETDHGLLEAKGLSSSIRGRTSFGDVVFSTTGPADIETLHGAIFAVFKTTDWDAPTSLKTLTGDIRAELPKKADVTVEATTTGEITTDYSIDIERAERGFRKQARAVIGAGRHQLTLATEKGALKLVESPF